MTFEFLSAWCWCYVMLVHCHCLVMGGHGDELQRFLCYILMPLFFHICIRWSDHKSTVEKSGHCSERLNVLHWDWDTTASRKRGIPVLHGAGMGVYPPQPNRGLRSCKLHRWDPWLMAGRKWICLHLSSEECIWQQQIQYVHKIRGNSDNRFARRLHCDSTYRAMTAQWKL